MVDKSYSVVATPEAMFILAPKADGSYEVYRSTTDPEEQPGTIYSAASSASAPYSFFAIDLPTLLQTPSFVVTSFEDIQRGGEQLAKIAYERLPESVGDELTQCGWILVSPTESWAVREVVLSSTSSIAFYRTRFVLDYDRLDGDIPIIKAYRRIAEDDRKQTRHDERREVVLEVGPGPTSLDEFSLSQFGMEDLGRPARHGVLVALMAVLAIVVTMLVRRLTAREARRVS